MTDTEDPLFSQLATLAKAPPIRCVDQNGGHFEKSVLEEFLRKQSPENLISLHRTYGYGATDCDCTGIFLPCPEHDLPRRIMIGKAILNGFDFADLGGLSDSELFGMAWAEIPNYRKRTVCDCPPLIKPCKHMLDCKPLKSPLTDAAKLVLLQLVHTLKHGEPERAEAQEGTDAATHATKSVPIAQRHELGYSIQSHADFVRRELPSEKEDRFERDPENGPNGQPDPGPVQLRIFEPDSDGIPAILREERHEPWFVPQGVEDQRGVTRCWACMDGAIVDTCQHGTECATCKRRRETMANRPKKRKAAI